jgi:hypothetical protein
MRASPAALSAIRRFGGAAVGTTMPTVRGEAAAAAIAVRRSPDRERMRARGVPASESVAGDFADDGGVRSGCDGSGAFGGVKRSWSLGRPGSTGGDAGGRRRRCCVRKRCVEDSPNVVDVFSLETGEW